MLSSLSGMQVGGSIPTLIPAAIYLEFASLFLPVVTWIFSPGPLVFPSTFRNTRLDLDDLAAISSHISHFVELSLLKS